MRQGRVQRCKLGCKKNSLHIFNEKKNWAESCDPKTENPFKSYEKRPKTLILIKVMAMPVQMYVTVNLRTRSTLCTVIRGSYPKHSHFHGFFTLTSAQALMSSLFVSKFQLRKHGTNSEHSR